MKDSLEIAIQASLKAGKAIMEVYNSVIEVEYKDDKSPLTAADQKSNDIINKFLKDTAYPIISEENKQISYAVRKSWQTCWIVDPVDGTKEFIKRNGEFTVNIALVRDGKPAYGVIYVPATKTLFYANVNQKEAFKAIVDSHDATLSDVLAASKPLQPKQNKTNLIEVVGSRSHMNQATLDYIATLKNKGKSVEVVSKGSSLKFCLVAEGLADIYPRFAPTMEWDTAAGQAICEAVGVTVINQDTKTPLLYNKENLLNPWFMVSSYER